MQLLLYVETLKTENAGVFLSTVQTTTKTRRLLFQLHEKLPFSHGGHTNIPAGSWGVSEMLTSSLFSQTLGTLNSKALSTSCGLCKIIMQCNHCQVMLYD